MDINMFSRAGKGTVQQYVQFNVKPRHFFPKIYDNQTEVRAYDEIAKVMGEIKLTAKLQEEESKQQRKLLI